MKAWNASGGSAGARTIASTITRDLGVKTGRWLAGKLIKELGIASCQVPAYKYKRAGNRHVEIPNHLNRRFGSQLPDQVWCGDVTYIWTGKCWANLAVALNLFACKPVGWAMSTSPDSALTVISAADDMGARWSSCGSDVPQRPGQPRYPSAISAGAVALPDKAEYESTG